MLDVCIAWVTFSPGAISVINSLHNLKLLYVVSYYRAMQVLSNCSFSSNIENIFRNLFFDMKRQLPKLASS